LNVTAHPNKLLDINNSFLFSKFENERRQNKTRSKTFSP